jgi:hypothetical protein
VHEIDATIVDETGAPLPTATARTYEPQLRLDAATVAERQRRFPTGVTRRCTVSARLVLS